MCSECPVRHWHRDFHTNRMLRTAYQGVLVSCCAVARAQLCCQSCCFAQQAPEVVLRATRISRRVTFFAAGRKQFEALFLCSGRRKRCLFKRRLKNALGQSSDFGCIFTRVSRKHCFGRLNALGQVVSGRTFTRVSRKPCFRCLNALCQVVFGYSGICMSQKFAFGDPCAGDDPSGPPCRELTRLSPVLGCATDAGTRVSTGFAGSLGEYLQKRKQAGMANKIPSV